MFGMSGYEYNVKRIGYNHPLLEEWCSYQAAQKWYVRFRERVGYCYYIVKRPVTRHRMNGGD